MRTAILILGVLCVLASAALAGPNAGGVLWVHDTGIVPSDVDIPWPPEGDPPGDCAQVDNQLPIDDFNRIWVVYAAFPEGSSPRLKAVSWGTLFPEFASSPYSYVLIEPGGCFVPDESGPGTDFYIGTNGFPDASGGEIGQSFPTGPRTTTVVRLFYFTGHGYTENGDMYGYPTWSTAPHSNPAYRFFFDDAVPAHQDPIIDYGSLGFGTPGYTPCPAPDPTALAACCSPEGACTLTTQADCPAPSVWQETDYDCFPNPCGPTGACCDNMANYCFISTVGDCPYAWLGAGVPCTPETCPGLPPPPGACCDFATGACTYTIEAECLYTWLGPVVPCNLETCYPPVPTERTSWGRIKNIFRADTAR